MSEEVREAAAKLHVAASKVFDESNRRLRYGDEPRMSVLQDELESTRKALAELGHLAGMPVQWCEEE